MAPGGTLVDRTVRFSLGSAVSPGAGMMCFSRTANVAVAVRETFSPTRCARTATCQKPARSNATCAPYTPLPSELGRATGPGCELTGGLPGRLMNCAVARGPGKDGASFCP